MELIVNNTIAAQDAVYCQWRHQFKQSTLEMTNRAYDLVMRKVEAEMVRLTHLSINEAQLAQNTPYRVLEQYA